LEETAQKMKAGEMKMGKKGKVLILANDLSTEQGCKSSVDNTVAAFGSEKVLLTVNLTKKIPRIGFSHSSARSARLQMSERAFFGRVQLAFQSGRPRKLPHGQILSAAFGENQGKHGPHDLFHP